MGLNMAITELQTDKALCKGKKLSTVKVFMEDPGKWHRFVETERIVDLNRVVTRLGQDKLDAILKKARIKAEGDELYLEKIKDPADQKALSPFVKEVKTRWILVEKVPSAERKNLVAAAKKENTVTEWDMLEFDEMYETCGRCGLSWDNKKGCVGNFGPSGSPLPELAKKYGLNILSKVNEAAEQKKVFSPKDAEKILEEIKVIRERAPSEGKMIVRRIEGTLSRLEAMAKCAKDYNVGFYFF